MYGVLGNSQSIYGADCREGVFSEAHGCNGVSYGDTQYVGCWFGGACKIKGNSKEGDAIHGRRRQQRSGSAAAAPATPGPQELGQVVGHVGDVRGRLKECCKVRK